MPAFLVQNGATIMCPHGGVIQAIPGGGNVRVRMSGQFIMLATDSFLVTGCPLPQPCFSVQWTAGLASRVRVQGQPALLQNGQGICLNVAQVPTGPPVIAATQTRVRGV